MRLDRVRIGERFVYGDRAGVWQKVSSAITKCIYGVDHDKLADVVPETPVFVFFDNGRFSRFSAQTQPNQGSGMKIVVLNDDNETLLEISDATAAQVAAYVNAEGILLKATDERPAKVDSAVVDHENRTVYITLL